MAMSAPPEPADSDAIAKARQAMRETINGEAVSKASPDEIAKAREALRQRVQSITYAEPTSNGGNPLSASFPPLEGPPLPISSEKQQRLNDLLQRYRADQITPSQYQTERAKILAGQ
jgi:hypothetical protein